MLPEQQVYCADVSVELGEPLLGTAAAETDAWIVLEQSEPWGPKGVEDSALPPAVVERLAALGKAFPRLRVQLVRRPEQSGGCPTLYLARSSEGLSELHEVPIQSFDDLPSLALEAWLASGVLPDGARPIEQPLYLVCVHGRRDRCCARRGMPVYAALRARAGDRVWQTTHLGGHRFAATMLVLPHGVCYGRVEVQEASALVAAHDRGELYEVARMRGRTCYPPAVQAADVLLRERLGERRLGALRFLESQPCPGGVRVSFEHVDGGVHSVEVAREPSPPAPASCGAAPKAGERFVQLGRAPRHAG